MSKIWQAEKEYQLTKQKLKKQCLVQGTALGVISTRSTKHKKQFIRNEKWTSPIFASFKEQTSPFFSNDQPFLKT